MSRSFHNYPKGSLIGGGSRKFRHYGVEGPDFQQCEYIDFNLDNDGEGTHCACDLQMQSFWELTLKLEQYDYRAKPSTGQFIAHKDGKIDAQIFIPLYQEYVGQSTYMGCRYDGSVRTYYISPKLNQWSSWEAYAGMNNQYVKCNDSQVWSHSGSVSSVTMGKDLYLGNGDNVYGATYGGFRQVKIRKYEIYNGSELVCNLQPGYRKSNNAIVFYDTVRDKILDFEGDMVGVSLGPEVN